MQKLIIFVHLSAKSKLLIYAQGGKSLAVLSSRSSDITKHHLDNFYIYDWIQNVPTCHENVEFIDFVNLLSPWKFKQFRDSDNTTENPVA